MRLRRLVLSGFKTFASRSEVSFDRGITAIVGPNGSGKSNLVDAVRWALGETNARELRGQRMDEVVYAGGGHRLRTAIAEVELLIDNEEGRLAIPGAEVAVTRRVVRGAHDTEYRINGDRVRLRDLERLLGSTGLTQNGYAVVAQNDIDSIIEATPQQRRALVEQAAGVRSLRGACEETLRRVTQAEAVVRRLDDLLGDAEPRLEELDGQRGAALEQRELAARLSELRGSLAREEWRAARGRLRQARRRLDHALDRLAAATEADAAFAERAEAERGRLRDARARRDAAAARLEAGRVAAERADGERRRLADRLRHAVVSRSLTRGELAAARSDAAALEASLHAGVAPAVVVDAARVRLEQAARAAAEAADAVAGARAAFEVVEREATDAAQAVIDVTARAAQVALQQDMLAAEAVRRAEHVQAAHAAVAVAEAALREADGAAAAADRAVAAADAALAAATSDVERSWDAVNAADGARAAASALARDAVMNAARLQGEVAGALGGEGGVARAVAAGVVTGRRLSECIGEVSPGDSVAVAAALEGHLGAWIVRDVADAASHLDTAGPREEVLREGDAGAATVTRFAGPGRAPLDAMEPDPEAVAVLVGLLEGTRLVDDEAAAQSALASGAARAVLPDGRVVSAAGVRGGGQPGHPLELVAQARDAGRAAAEAATAEAQAIAAAAEARERLASAEALVAEQTRGVAVTRARSAEAAVERRARSSAVETAAADLRAADSLAEQAVSAAATLEQERVRLEAQRAEAEQRVAAGAERRGAAEAHIAELRERVAAARREERDAELDLERLQDRGPGHTLEEVTRLADNARRRADAAESRLASVEGDAVAAVAEGRRLLRVARFHGAAVAEARRQLDIGDAPIAALERAVLGLEAEHAEVAVSLARAEDERATAAAEVSGAETDLERLADAAREDDDAADWDPAAAERAEREIVRLERRIAALGPVNALAPEQHAALEVRVRAQQRDRDDLEWACRTLRRMTRHLAADLERRFDAVFGAVCVHFQDVFAELFPGGRATLRLEEPLPEDAGEEQAEDVAERRPGVEILAQPPGKRLCPLRLLSGGERALTALATVLALQQVNPSPFYVFDEVDAALDDSNVLRFTRLLRRLAQQQQFIVVTHNHITMAAADVLWGVTIDGDGVSSVIGVRFDADAPAGVAATTRAHPDERRVAG